MASDDRGEASVPSATGLLSTTPLAHALVYAHTKRVSGRLDLDAPDGRSGSVLFQRGRVAAVRTVPPGNYFGGIAYELGLIDLVTLDRTLGEVARTKQRHGEILVAGGALTDAQRDRVLAEQIHRKVHALFALPDETRYAFFDARAPLESDPTHVDPLASVWRGVAENPPLRFVADVLARIGTLHVRIVNRAVLASVPLPPEELELCTVLQHRRVTLRELRLATSLPASRVELLVYFLVITRALEAEAGVRTQPSIGAMPAPSPSAASLPPPPLRVSSSAPDARPSGLQTRIPAPPPLPTPQAIAAGGPVTSAMTRTPVLLGAAGIRALAERIETESYFEVLGLPEGASSEAARAAFFRIGRLWHPDRVGAELADVRAEAAKVFAYMSRAHATLCDPSARSAYVASRQGRVRTRAEVLRDIDKALETGEFETAATEADQLSAAAPDDVEALAIAIWSRARAGDAEEAVLRGAVQRLDKVILTDRTCDRALYYRGYLSKRLGDNVAAFRDFARAVQMNPKHVEATREVRLYEIRARKGSGEHVLDQIVLRATGRKR